MRATRKRSPASGRNRPGNILIRSPFGGCSRNRISEESGGMVLAVKSSIVKSRIRKIEECVTDLEGIRKLPERLFVADRPVRAAAERLLQVAIQSLLDIGSHIIAERGFREADGYAEIIDILGEEGVLPKRFAARIRGMAGLRNILVHDYLEVDPRELRKHLRRLNDFERYSRYVVEYLRL